MIGMIKRILDVSGKYKGRIYGAMVLSFLKGMLMKVPAIVTFLIVSVFIDGKLTKKACIYAAIALVGSVAVQAVFQNIADRLQSAAGYMIFADMRMKLGEHLRRLPMGFFTEGNIGRISSVLSTDMVFIEENCMAVLADIMSYQFSQCIMILFMFFFDWRLGLASLAVTVCMIILGRGMVRSDLSNSKERQDASEIQTKAVLDFTEGIGIIKTYNLLGGKSTIASLLARFWDIQSGEILLRGMDIRKIPLATLMDNISMVFQRVYLFQDTVCNNIALGRPDASREEIIEAAKKARCYDFIMELPDGFDTVIGEGGASLSGGQAQRLSIARCILKDSPIVILDEATASVDADNESYIQQAISELCKGKTLLVIAHRINTIVEADNIMVIRDGQIAESGNHDSLMQTDGIYHSMVTKRAAATGWKN